MNPLLDHLYERLPVVLRQRDHDQGEPLRALLQVIAEQVDVVEEDNCTRTGSSRRARIGRCRTSAT